MPFLNSIAFLEMTDVMAKQAQLLDAAVTDMNVVGSNGLTYDNVRVLLDPDVESNNFLASLRAFDLALTRSKLYKPMSKWSAMIDSFNKSLVKAGDLSAQSIDAYLTQKRIRVSPWFAILHAIVKNSSLSSKNVFPEDPTTPGTPIQLATITVGGYTGMTGNPPDLTGVTGVTGIAGDPGWMPAILNVVMNPDYTVGGAARLGQGGVSKFVEFDSADPSKYNAGAGEIYLEVLSDPTPGIDEDFVLKFTMVDENKVLVTRYVTIPTGSGVGTKVTIQNGRYLQINKIEEVFGGDLDVTIGVFAAVDRTISI